MLIETRFSYLILHPKVSSGCYFSMYQAIFSIFHINLAAWTVGSCRAATQSPWVIHVGRMSPPLFWMGCMNLMRGKGALAPCLPKGKNGRRECEKEKLVM